MQNSACTWGFPGGATGKELTCQCRIHKKCGSDPWVGKLPWRRAWLPTPVFLPGESPWTEAPGRLLSIGSQRVGHNWATKHSTNVTFVLLILILVRFSCFLSWNWKLVRFIYLFKYQLLISLIFSIVFLVSMAFISVVIFPYLYEEFLS